MTSTSLTMITSATDLSLLALLLLLTLYHHHNHHHLHFCFVLLPPTSLLLLLHNQSREQTAALEFRAHVCQTALRAAIDAENEKEIDLGLSR